MPLVTIGSHVFFGATKISRTRQSRKKHWVPALQGCDVGRQPRLHSVGLHGVCARQKTRPGESHFFSRVPPKICLKHVETSNNLEPWAIFWRSTLLPGMTNPWKWMATAEARHGSAMKSTTNWSYPNKSDLIRVWVKIRYPNNWMVNTKLD